MERVVSRDPATGEIVFSAPASSAGAVADAVARASLAAPEWARTSVAERAAVLRRFAHLVEDDAADFAALITAEVGRMAAEADGEVEWTAVSARWYADNPPQDEAVGSAHVRRRPLGVVAAITPWNVPLVTPAWKWLPALIAGNAVLWKPSELATATALRATALLTEAGVPDGVMSVVPGAARTARALVGDQRVQAVHFTGSTHAGRALVALTGQRFVRCALEMGGVNSAIVFADADLDQAAQAIVASVTALSGQKCTATRRVLVHGSVADELTQRLVSRVEMLRLGNPRSATTTLGPLIHPDASTRAQLAVAAAVDRGGRIAGRSSIELTDDVRPDAFFPATVISGLAPDDPLQDEEVFAPVIVIGSFTDVEEAWTEADNSEYGLAAAIHTRDPALVAAARDRLTTGVLAVNRRADAVELEAPFGGRRASGNGFPEGGRYVYDAVTDLQAVYGGISGDGRMVCDA